MGIGIIVCGLNGSGKSTLGKALSEKLRFHFIDNENLFFPKTDLNYIYASPRSHEEAVKLLMNEVSVYENFVFAAVKGDYGNEILPFYQYAVLMDVPKDIRLNRVRKRSLQIFGNRMLPGGDLHEHEEKFFNMVGSRTESYVEEWVQSLNCQIIRIDGTKPIEENIRIIIEQMQI
jgi:adenylate kinase family enzyme